MKDMTFPAGNWFNHHRDKCFLNLVWFLVCSALVAGCDTVGNSGSAEKTANQDVVQTEIERGPIKLVLQAAPASPQLSDEITLTLTIQSKPGTAVTKPPFADSFPDFVVRDFVEPLATRENDLQVERQVYTLEPLKAGTLTISPMVVRFHDTVKKADVSDETAHAIETEPLQIEVTTIVADQAPSLADLRPASDPVELPDQFRPVVVWSSIVGILVMAALLWFYKRRRKSASVEPQLSPHQLAQIELQQLIDQRLAETDVKVFYVELTAVVRRFIERTTGIRAPEQTTEEFLREIVTNNVFSLEEQSRLANFLESADLVKFAGVQPNPADIESSLSRARHFIDHLHLTSQLPVESSPRQPADASATQQKPLSSREGSLRP